MEDRLSKVRAEIERRYKECKGATPATEYQELLDFIDSMQEEPTIPDIVDEHFDEMLGEELASSYKPDNFEMALTEMIDKARKCVIEPWAFAAQWKDELLGLAKGEEPVIKDRFVFKAIPRLLDMIEPTDRAKAYTTKLAEALEKEGYTTDAKIVRESIKIMNGEKVAMATMTEEPVSEDFDMWYEKEWIPFSHSSYTEKDILEEAYKAGANWQKQQMMKDAVDAEIGYFMQRSLSIHLDKSLEKIGFDEFDKVKLIIIKED